MIFSFGNSDTEQVWLGNRVKKLPLEIQNIGRKLKEFYSIRINDQWRIIFKWNSSNAYEVEIIDYH